MTPVSELPVWRNIIARTVVYYAITLTAAWYAHGVIPLTLDPTTVGAIDQLLTGASSTAAPALPPAAVGAIPTSITTAIATAIAMLTAFLSSLPVAWIYTLTRRKKGFQQSVVQTYLILPVVAAGIVILVKSSLPLAFALAGIVAAVRFRTSLDDSKDAAGIFVVIGIGMAAGAVPPVAWVISVGFNLLMLGLWWTDFGRPAALEGKDAQRRLERALATANRTGMFLARMDEEVLKSMSPEQLEALADRAWRRRKRNDPDATESEKTGEQRVRYEKMLRVRADDPETARALIEVRFTGLFASWKYLGSVRENDVRVLEYGVILAETVTPGVVSDDLGSIPNSPLRGVELR
ncbi:MAG: DUF4956 domain-containing protein [Gemmatimonadaceae bacterium]|nr:DUF4956 domain-containing protein [Gemmatimonadaceae bacterium]